MSLLDSPTRVVEVRLRILDILIRIAHSLMLTAMILVRMSRMVPTIPM